MSLRVWGRTLLAVIALVVPTLTAIPAGASGGTVHLTVVGGGAVDAAPGTDCPADSACDYTQFPAVFSAVPVEPAGATSGWRFGGWSGACSGTGDCNFSADASGEYWVTATFVEVFKLTVTMQGSGQVTGNRISCSTGLTCSQYYDVASATSVTLTTTAVPGYAFGSWAGDCDSSPCTVSMVANRSVTATFTCATASVANPIAAAVPAASSPVSYGTVRGCFASLPPAGSPNAAPASVIGSFPQDGGTFGVLTTGSAAVAGTANTNGLVGGTSTNLSGNPVRGSSDYDVSILRLDFTAASDACLAFNFQFLSEEFGDTLGYNDAFIAEVDNSSWFTLSSGEGTPVEITADDNFAYAPSGSEISVAALKTPISSAYGDWSAAAASGTTYDGATKVLQARAAVSKGPHALFLSVFDAGDHGLDSAVFLDTFRLESAAGGCSSGATDVKYPLVVDIETPGGGTVTASTGSLACTATACGGYYDKATPETEVTLSASPSSSYRFVGWEGEGCAGTATCTVTMGDLRRVTAKFVQQFTLVAPEGFHVSSDDPAVGGKYDAGTIVTVTPSSGTVAGWFGCSDISGNGQICTAVMNHDRTITAGSGTTALSVTDVRAPSEPVGSGDRISYSIKVSNTGGATNPVLRVAFALTDGQTLLSALPLVSSGCALPVGSTVYACQLNVPVGGAQIFGVTVDAPLVSPDALLKATFSLDSVSPSVASAGASSVSTLVQARPAQDYRTTNDSSAGLSTFADFPIDDRNPTGTSVATSVAGKKATIGEVFEGAAAPAVVSTTSTKTTSATSTTQPTCDTKLLLTCWRFDLDAPELSGGYYTFTFVWDRTTFTNPDGTLQISLRKIFMYHRADGKTSYTKLAACATTGKVAYPCVKSIALQASTGDLYIVVQSITNGQWKGGR